MPLWKRWWFWLLAASGAVLTLAVILVLILGSAGTVTLSPVKTVDYTRQPDGPEYVLGHVSSQVQDGASVLTHMQPGPMYLTMEDVGATNNIGFSARTGWSTDSTAAGSAGDVGVLVLNADVEGYAATCSRDGTGVVWSVGVRNTVPMGTIEDSGCTQSNDLRIEVTRGMTGDLVGVTFPNGEKAAFLPGSSKAPFTGIGVMSMPLDPSANPPQVLVYGYTVLMPE